MSLPHLNDPPKNYDELDKVKAKGEHKRVKIKPSNKSLEVSINSFTTDTSIKLPFGKSYVQDNLSEYSDHVEISGNQYHFSLNNRELIPLPKDPIDPNLFF